MGNLTAIYIHQASFYEVKDRYYGPVKLRLFHLLYWILLCYWFWCYIDKQIIWSNCIHAIDDILYCSWYKDSNHQNIQFCLWNTVSPLQSDFPLNANVTDVVDKLHVWEYYVFLSVYNVLFSILWYKKSNKILCYNHVSLFWNVDSKSDMFTGSIQMHNQKSWWPISEF